MKTDLSHTRQRPDCLDQNEDGISLASQSVAPPEDGSNYTLARIEAALARMAQGEYGQCTICKAPISVDVLEADPATAQCKRCKT